MRIAVSASLVQSMAKWTLSTDRAALPGTEARTESAERKLRGRVHEETGGQLRGKIDLGSMLLRSGNLHERPNG